MLQRKYLFVLMFWKLKAGRLLLNPYHTFQTLVQNTQTLEQKIKDRSFSLFQSYFNKRISVVILLYCTI